MGIQLGGGRGTHNLDIYRLVTTGADIRPVKGEAQTPDRTLHLAEGAGTGPFFGVPEGDDGVATADGEDAVVVVSALAILMWSYVMGGTYFPRGSSSRQKHALVCASMEWICSREGQSRTLTRPEPVVRKRTSPLCDQMIWFVWMLREVVSL